MAAYRRVYNDVMCMAAGCLLRKWDQVQPQRSYRVDADLFNDIIKQMFGRRMQTS